MTQGTEYVQQLTAELVTVQDRIAQEYGEQARPNGVAVYVGGETPTPGIFQATYYNEDGNAEAAFLLVTGETVTAPLTEFEACPPLPPLGGRPVDWWSVTNRAGAEVARVGGADREQARRAAERVPAARRVSRLEGGLSYRRLTDEQLTEREREALETVST